MLRITNEYDPVTLEGEEGDIGSAEGGDKFVYLHVPSHSNMWNSSLIRTNINHDHSEPPLTLNGPDVFLIQRNSRILGFASVWQIFLL